MPKKKSVETSARKYIEELKEVKQFLDRAKSNKSLTKKDATWIYEYGIIRIYKGFEELMLECLVGALNNDDVLSERSGIPFPKHLKKDVCEYIVIGNRYFDFRGRDGLIKKLKEFLPDDHYLIKIIKDETDNDTLDILVAFRNYAVHPSKYAKKRARLAAGNSRMTKAGAWLKTQNRLENLVAKLEKLASNIHDAAPY